MIAREKTKIFDENDKLIGKITSGTFGPSVKGPIAMGYVSNEMLHQILKFFRGKRKKIPANVCDYHFIKKTM